MGNVVHLILAWSIKANLYIYLSIDMDIDSFPGLYRIERNLYIYIYVCVFLII